MDVLMALGAGEPGDLIPKYSITCRQNTNIFFKKKLSEVP